MRAAGIVLACMALPVWAQAPQMSSSVKLVVMGDSLSSGFQLKNNEDFGAQMEAYARARGYDLTVVNLSRVAQTTHDGLYREDEILAAKPDVLILQLGYNDALMGADLNESNKTLNTLLHDMQLKGIVVLLVRSTPPDTLRPMQKRQYDYMFGALSQYYRVSYCHSFMDGVEGHKELTIADGYHPNSEGVKVIVQRIFPTVEEDLRYAIRLKHYQQELH